LIVDLAAATLCPVVVAYDHTAPTDFSNREGSARRRERVAHGVEIPAQQVAMVPFGTIMVLLPGKCNSFVSFLFMF